MNILSTSLTSHLKSGNTTAKQVELVFKTYHLDFQNLSFGRPIQLVLKIARFSTTRIAEDPLGLFFIIPRIKLIERIN